MSLLTDEQRRMLAEDFEMMKYSGKLSKILFDKNGRPWNKKGYGGAILFTYPTRDDIRGYCIKEGMVEKMKERTESCCTTIFDEIFQLENYNPFPPDAKIVIRIGCESK